MRQVCCRAHGGPEVLRVEEAPRPEPGEGEVLVEVDAVGVALPMVRLTRRADVPLPHVPGGDVAGRVAAAGPGVTGVRIGERVAALAFTGAYAEYVTVPAAFVFPLPDEVDGASG
ncbi:alcohol dehydrogenase catalytic domain-containing protein, partial [Actinoallomurus acaciae]